MSYPQQKPKIDRTEKSILSIFIIVGIVSIIVGFLYFKQTISSPFTNISIDYNKKTNAALETEQLLAYKSQDSDGDGLTDYDEIFQYNTSRFLSDTDSDNTSDGDEIKKGTDPLCPAGKDCTQTVSNANSNENSNINSGVVNINELTPEQVRELLRQKGFTDEELEAINDEDLMQAYYEAANASMQNANNNTNSTSSQAAEIRQTLVSSGKFTEQDLKNINDSDLIKMYEEAFVNSNINS